MEINELCRTAHEAAQEAGWYSPTRTFPEDIALMHSELSEALQDYRDGCPINVFHFTPERKPVGIPIELADAVIRIAQACGLYEIDLESAIKEKLKYNKTRGYRHGGKLV